MLNYFDKEAAIEVLKDLLEKARRGELKTAFFRVYRADGTHEDIVVGAESEKERLALLAEFDSAIKT